MDLRYAVTHIKVEDDIQIRKKNDLFEVQSYSFQYFEKKKVKKKGKTENFVYTIGKRCLSFDIVTISDVTTGQLQNV